MKNDEIAEFVKYNNDNLKFKIEMRLKALYASFIIIKLINCDFYCILVNYI